MTILQYIFVLLIGMVAGMAFMLFIIFYYLNEEIKNGNNSKTS